MFHIVGQPNLEIQIDREPCARYGINVADVEAAVQVAIGGEAFPQMVEGEKLYDIVLRLPTTCATTPTTSPASRWTSRAIRRKARARIPLSHWPRSSRTSPGVVHLPREQPPLLPIKFSVGSRPRLGDRRGQAKVNDPKNGDASRRATGSTGPANSPRWKQANDASWIVPLSIGPIMFCSIRCSTR